MKDARNCHVVTSSTPTACVRGSSDSRRVRRAVWMYCVRQRQLKQLELAGHNEEDKIDGSNRTGHLLDNVNLKVSACSL